MQRASWCDLDLIFDIAAVALTFIILYGPCLRNCKVQEVNSWMGHLLGSIVMLSHGVKFNLGSAKVCSPAIFETFYHKDLWIGLDDLQLHKFS